MFDELFPNERDVSLSQSVRRPYTPPGPGAWAGFGGALADIVPYSVYSAGAAWQDVLDAYGKASAFAEAPIVGWASPSELENKSFWSGWSSPPSLLPWQGGKAPPDAQQLREETVDKMFSSPVAKGLRERAKDFSPDPASVGVAGRITHGLASTLVKVGTDSALFGPLAPLALGIDAGVNRTQELRDEGVSGGTATLAGGITGVANAVGMKLPAALGATRLQSAAIGAVMNPALNIAEVGGTRLLLQHADYQAIAAQYQPFDPVSLSVAAIAGGAFGAAFHSNKPSGLNAKTEARAGEGQASPEPINTTQTRDGAVGDTVGSVRPAESAQAETGQSPTPGKSKEEILSDIRAELIADAGNRASPGEIPTARSQLDSLQNDIERIQSEQVFKAEAKAAQGRGLSRKQAESAARKVIGQRLADMQSQADRLSGFIETNRRASQAEQELAALDRGQVPERFAQLLADSEGEGGSQGKTPGATLSPLEYAAVLTMHEVQVRDGDSLAPMGDPAALSAARDAQAIARMQLDSGTPVSVAERLTFDRTKLSSAVSRLWQAPVEGGGRVSDVFVRLKEEAPVFNAPQSMETRGARPGAQAVDNSVAREPSPNVDAPGQRMETRDSASGKATPEQALAAEIASRNPDAVVRLEDGSEMRMSDLLQEVQKLEAQAKSESAAYMAAVNCALRFPQ